MVYAAGDNIWHNLIFQLAYTFLAVYQTCHPQRHELDGSRFPPSHWDYSENHVIAVMDGAIKAMPGKLISAVPLERL